MSEKLRIKKAAVLGAGVMGAQIAAYMSSCGVKTYLFDLPSQSSDSRDIAKGAIKALSKLKPSPLATLDDAALIEPCNYEDDLEYLKQCDFILEAISERRSYKEELFKKIAPFISKTAVLASNTSGISIEALAASFPEDLRARFLGVHFFNPPRYMKLVECIPHQQTDVHLIAQLEEFLVVRLGKGVVYAKDTPNFVGNRIGVFAMLSVLHHAQAFGLTPDMVDTLTGVLIGRPKSATYRTIDIVGLDTMNHVVQTLKDGLSEDPWNHYFELPDWILGLIQRGSLGQKSKIGIYKKQKDKIVVFDSANQVYREAGAKPSAEVIDILKLPPSERLISLQASQHPQAQFLWACFRDLFHYCANILPDIAETTRDIDLALRWGYGWEQGPFELWQLSGTQVIASLIEKDIQAGKTMSKTPLAAWFDKNAQKAFYQDGQAFAPEQKKWLSRANLSCYERQLSPDRVLDEPTLEGRVIFENDGLTMWTMNDSEAIVSFKTKRNCISQAVLEGMLESIDRAEKDFNALVLWQRQGTDFSVGANLKEIVGAIQGRQFGKIDHMIQLFHKVALKLKYASVPTVAAISGLCLGGGTEFALHTHRRVANYETYMGLPEVGIGVIPGGGGCKELALRALDQALVAHDLKPLEKVFQQVATAQVSSSSKDAMEKWYLSASDKHVANRNEILFEAIQEAKRMQGPAFFSAVERKVIVPGKTAIANFQAFLVNMREGQFISDHDYLIGCKLANVFCGGSVDAGTEVDEQWFLDLEKAAFMELVESPLTLARIEHTLKTGKPLRN